MAFNDYQGLRRIDLGAVDRDILPDANQSHDIGTSGNRFATVAADVAYAQRLVAPTNHMDIVPGSGQRIRLFGEVNQGTSMYDAQTGTQQATLLHNSSNQLHLFSNAPTLFAISCLLGPLYLYSVVGNVKIQARAGQQQVQVSGHLMPEGDTEVFDVGSSTKKWRTVYGASGVFDSKSFVIPHPTLPGASIQYVCQEGPEYGIYCRGNDNLRGGSVFVRFNGEFEHIVRPESITIQITPMGACPGLYYNDVTPSGFVVYGDHDITFSWRAEGVRKDKPAEYSAIIHD